MTRRRVVVIGAGPAGLLAAWAVSHQADEVLVLDRDRFPCEPVPRDGVPQDRHWSLLDRRGLEAIEGLLPGFTKDAVAAGARPDPGGIVIRRPLLEALVRRRVTTDSSVRLLPGSSVVDLDFDTTGRRVCGVVVADVDRSTTTHLPADHVIDASGQHTRSSAWLTRRGIAVTESRVGINATFVTREYARDPSEVEPPLVRHLVPGPAEGEWRRAAVVVAVGDRWLVTLAGSHGLRPPADPVGFATYAAGVDPALGDLVRAHPGAGEAAVHRLPSKLTRDIADEALDGLALTGDARQTADPLAMSGLTAAARSAALLGELSSRTPIDGLGAAWLELARRTTTS